MRNEIRRMECGAEPRTYWAKFNQELALKFNLGKWWCRIGLNFQMRLYRDILKV